MEYRTIYACNFRAMPIVAWTPNVCGVIDLPERPSKLQFGALDLGVPGGAQIYLPDLPNATERARWFITRAAGMGVRVKWVPAREWQAENLRDDYPQWPAWRRALGLDTQWG